MSDFAGKRSPVCGKPVTATTSSESSPGKHTLVEQTYGNAVQRRPSESADEPGAHGEAGVHASAARGVATPGSPLPHGDRIQRLFGRHDLSSIQAHVGGAAESAANEMGADAYATGNHVVLGKGADLFTAAHEAAHVVQQRGGVQLKDGVGTTGDAHEQHADAVAARVSAGQSAEGLLDEYASRTAAAPQVQRKTAASRPLVAGKDMFQTASGTITKLVDQVPGAKATTRGDKVHVTTPGVSMVGTFRLKPDVDPDPATVDVGWVQTLVSSERIGVYKKGGAVHRKDITALTQTRDALTSAPQTRAPLVVPAPWYAPPSQITKTQRTAYPITDDNPQMKVPTTLSDARLAELQGADKFKVSLSFGSGGTVEHVQSFAWEAPWNVVLDPSTGEGIGSEISILNPPSTHEVPADDRPANEVGNDPKSRIQTYETEAAAIEGLARGIVPFITELPKHKAKAPSSYWNMVGALWKSAARVHVRFTPRGDAPDVKVAFRSDKTVDVDAEKGDREYSALAHMVYDPAAIGPGHSIRVMVNGMSQISLTWPYNTAKTEASWIKPGVFSNTEYHYDLEAWLR